MQNWKWLYTPESPFNWRFVRNVLIKTMLLFAMLNLLFVVFDPLSTLGSLSGYNLLFKGRDRLPYGENPSASYNVSLLQLDAMFASHKIAGHSEHNSFRVVLIGDSSVWGILLEPKDSLAGLLDAAHYRTDDSALVQVFNLGYPTMSLAKDLLILDYAMRYDPDLIVWSFTLESFDQETQLDSALVQHNPVRMRSLIKQYGLKQNPNDSRFVDLSPWDKTIIQRRRALADILRLQYYGVAWSVTGIDQDYDRAYTSRAVDLAPDDTWHGFRPGSLSETDLAFDILHAGVDVADKTPVVFVNEPMLISQGKNSAIRYNAFYPRWAYDDFRSMLHDAAKQGGWTLIDLWDILPDPECYTDSAVHLTPSCSSLLANRIASAIMQRISSPEAIFCSACGNERTTSLIK